MRYNLWFLAGAAVAASPAYAAEELRFAPVPAWVVSQSIPTETTKSTQAPVALLLNDAQIRLERGKIASFTELALKVQTVDGLQAGNVAFAWQPATDTVTVNKLHILRDGKIIDVLKSGQTFTVARRETNMEAAVLDGTLTANIQPEGLEVGDIINLALTTERVEPVMKGHVESMYGGWDGSIIKRAHARISWPAGLELITRQTDELPQPKRSIKDGWNVIELSAEGVEPLLLPKGAPMRFRVGRMGEATDFQAWSDLSDLMAPMYRQAAVVPKTGPLRDEVEKIRQMAKSEKARAEKALQLVEERIRYVALAMGAGGYVPASAELTWSRRFGDCKAKTALLIALLEELGIAAEPVLVHSTIGNALPERLPMVTYFDHVIVRALVGAKTYWLDGTRSGDADLDQIPVPNFEWGLPLKPGAKLVPIVQPPLEKPATESTIAIDATEGVYAPAQFKVDQIFRGDGARALNLIYSKMAGAQAQQMLRDYWRKLYDYVTIGETASAYDGERAEFRLSMTGTAKLKWDDGWLYVPGSTIAYEADFERAPGSKREAPFQLAYPTYETTRVSVKLPPGFATQENKVPAPVRERLAGVEYVRTVSLDGDELIVESSERSLRPEIPYEDALAAEPRLKALYDEDVYLRIPAGYRSTESDIAAKLGDTPASAKAYISRGLVLVESGNIDEAIGDFSKALEFEPDNLKALTSRAIAYVLKRDVAAAEKDLAAAEAKEPNNPVAARARGLLAELDGDHSAAVAAFSQSLVGEPNHGFALAHRAAAHRALGDDEQALADTERALKAGYRNPDVRLLRANIFRGQGKHDLAIEEAELLIKENPESDFALVAAGRILSAENRHDAAMEAFDRALALKRAAYIYVNRSQARRLTDFVGRMSDLDEALKLESGHPEALAFKASLLLRQGKHSEALELYEYAMETNLEATSGVREALAVALHKIGKVEEAERAFAELRSQSKSANAFNNLCWTKATAGILLESAMEDCRKALELSPDTPAYLDSLGMALLRLGRLDEADDAYTRAIAKAPIASSFMGRAIVHARKGDSEQAKADRAEALKIDPDAEARFAEYGVEFPDFREGPVSK